MGPSPVVSASSSILTTRGRRRVAGPDNDLFNFANKTISASGVSTFRTTISRNILDEDDGVVGVTEGDEVYAQYTLRSNEPIFPFSTTQNSPVINGNF